MFTPKVLIPLVLIVGLLLLNLKAQADFTEPQVAQELVKNGALLVDVRTPGEYQTGHIEGAINIPVSEVESRLKEFGDKEQNIVVYCRSGARSGRARSMLLSQGFKKVYNLGGIGRWPR